MIARPIVYRAENSNTHRHMTEFTGIDLEMAIERDYHEALDVLDDMLLHIFKGLQKDWAGDITTVKRQHPHGDFVFLEKTLRLNFRNAIELLREASWKEVGENGQEQELSEYDDLSTAAERQLGRIVKEKFHTDYYILGRWASSTFAPEKDLTRLSIPRQIPARDQAILHNAGCSQSQAFEFV